MLNHRWFEKTWRQVDGCTSYCSSSLGEHVLKTRGLWEYKANALSGCKINNWFTEEVPCHLFPVSGFAQPTIFQNMEPK